MNPQVWWFLARATGIVSWALLALAVIWGLLLSSRIVSARSAPKWLLDLHRMLGGLAVSFVVIHVATLVGDSYVHFGTADVLVPFASSWKPGPVGIGILAAYIVIAVEVSSLLMKHLPRPWWRRIHMSSFAAYAMATGHGLWAGTDTTNPGLFAAYVASAALVVFFSVFRVLTKSERRPAARRASPAT